MAVIITDMDMPKSCLLCWYKVHCNFFNPYLTDIQFKHTNCPLKSADEYVLKGGEEWNLHYKNAFNDGFVEASKQDERIMKKQIDEMIAEINFLSNSEVHDNSVTIYSWNGMKKKVLDIIHKYCDKENNNE